MSAATRISAVPLSAKVRLHHAAGQRLLGCTAAPGMAALLKCSLSVGAVASCPACNALCTACCAHVLLGLHPLQVVAWLSCWALAWLLSIWLWDSMILLQAPSLCSLCKPPRSGCHKALSAATTSLVSRCNFEG